MKNKFNFDEITTAVDECLENTLLLLNFIGNTLSPM
jgi:hypothetical protein